MHLDAGIARTFPYIGMALVVAANVSGNVLLKLGSTAALGRASVFGFSWQSLVGVGCFGMSVILYLWVLKYLPLYMAQSIAALQIAGAILAANLLLGEAMSPRQWVGVIIIGVGMVVVVR